MTPTAQTTQIQSAGAFRHRAPTISHNTTVALAYAAAGIPVLACTSSGSRAKQPLTERGHHDATADLDQVRRWWRRWPDALVGIPTGPASGLWVVDIDGECGRRSLNDLLTRLGLETIAELTRCISRTPNGLHLMFRLQAGERPRNRACDIGAGLDTRGVKADGRSAGYFIAPGSMLPDRRRYEFVDAVVMEPIEMGAEPFASASSAPRALLYLATFGKAERAVITASPELWQAIRENGPAEWFAILEKDLATKRAALAQRGTQRPADAEGIRTQALHDLREAANTYAGLQDGRRSELFNTAARLARYVAHCVLSESELRSALRDAAAANGALGAHGARWCDGCITRALRLGANDPLPPLARRFRSTGRVEA